MAEARLPQAHEFRLWTVDLLHADHSPMELARCHRGQIGLLVNFNDPIARRIMAASDFCLMPSRFEPCGRPVAPGQARGGLGQCPNLNAHAARRARSRWFRDRTT